MKAADIKRNTHTCKFDVNDPYKSTVIKAYDSPVTMLETAVTLEIGIDSRWWLMSQP